MFPFLLLPFMFTFFIFFIFLFFTFFDIIYIIHIFTFLHLIMYIFYICAFLHCTFVHIAFLCILFSLNFYFYLHFSIFLHVFLHFYMFYIFPFYIFTFCYIFDIVTYIFTFLHVYIFCSFTCFAFFAFVVHFFAFLHFCIFCITLQYITFQYSTAQYIAHTVRAAERSVPVCVYSVLQHVTIHSRTHHKVCHKRVVVFCVCVSRLSSPIVSSRSHLFFSRRFDVARGWRLGPGVPIVRVPLWGHCLSVRLLPFSCLTSQFFPRVGVSVYVVLALF